MVSVIVPIYNVAEYLPQCIESICCQTWHDMEIILVDDGSTDGSSRICDVYAGKDGRIRVIHKTNGGLANARKTGLAAARGEYISCVDSDDWIEPDMLQKLLDAGKNADIIAFAGYEECGKHRKMKGNTAAEGLYDTEEKLQGLYNVMLMDGNFFTHGISTSIWNKLFKRHVLERPQMKVPDVVSYGEDTACVYPCILAAGSVFVTNMPFYHYRVRQGSIVRSRKVSNENFQYLYRTLKSDFDLHIQKETLNMQLKYYMWQALLLKGYDRIGSGMALFPFERVKPGMQVAVYGAGLFGQVIEGHCRKSDCLSVAGWFDQRYDMYAGKGFPVEPAWDMPDRNFDVIVIAILDEGLALHIREDFIKRGIAKGRIDFVRARVLDKMDLPDFIRTGFHEGNNI